MILILNFSLKERSAKTHFKNKTKKRQHKNPNPKNKLRIGKILPIKAVVFIIGSKKLKLITLKIETPT